MSGTSLNVSFLPNFLDLGDNQTQKVLILPKALVYVYMYKNNLPNLLMNYCAHSSNFNHYIRTLEIKFRGMSLLEIAASALVQTKGVLSTLLTLGLCRPVKFLHSKAKNT